MSDGSFLLLLKHLGGQFLVLLLGFLSGALTEPLEVSLRARLGRTGKSRGLIAVIEPLEASLRALNRQVTRKTKKRQTPDNPAENRQHSDR